MSSLCYSQNSKKQYAAGNFIITVITKNNAQPQIAIANRAEPKRLLWQTVPGVALIGAAEGKDSIRMHGKPEGLFTVTDTILQSFNEQSISKISAQNNQLTINGKLTGTTGNINYTLMFKQVSDNQLQFNLNVQGANAKGVNRLFLRYASPENEYVYGFGEQLSYFDQKGKEIPVIVQEHGIGRGLPGLTWLVNRLEDGGGGNPYITGIPAPQYITSKLNSLFLENKEYAVFNLKVADRIEVKLFSDSLTGRIIYGKTPLELIKEYTAYSGRMRKLPDWINNGAIVCVQYGMDTVQKRLAQLDSAGVPLAALWIQDWCGGRKTNVGHQLWWNWHLDTTYYPGWDSMVSNLHQRNVQVLTYINPFLADTGSRNDLYLYAKAHDYLVKQQNDSPYLIHNSFTAALIDLSNTAACAWIKGLIDSELIIKAGSSGWMADFAEALPYDAKLYNNASTSYWHNHYTEKWAEINREAIIASGIDSNNLVFFNRSGFAQSPSHSTLFWLGDQLQTWDKYDGIKTALTGMLSGGMSGFSLMHSDIGGYNAFSVDTLSVKFNIIARSKELLMRWEELNIFNAVYRTHDGLKPEISAQYHTDDETMAHFTRSTKIFKALSFYRKQLIQAAADSGYPIVRHPFIQFPDDPNIWTLNYQFMYGSEFMVAPVLDKGQISVKLYLPKGNWVNLWSGETIKQIFGGWVTTNAPIGQPVMFYQKGSKVAKQFIDSLKAAGIYNNVLNNNPDNIKANVSHDILKAKVFPNSTHDVCTVEINQAVHLPVTLTVTDVNGSVRKTQRRCIQQKVNKYERAFQPVNAY